MRNTFAPIAVLAAVALAVVTAPSVARAQTMNMVVQEFGGRSSPVVLFGASGRPISGEECRAGEDIPIEITNIPYELGATQVLSVWRGSPSSGMCQTATQRQSMGSSMPPCQFVTSFMVTSAMMTVRLDTAEAFASCDAATEQEFWFLLVNSAMDTSTNVTSFVTLRAALDPTAPTAPTNVSSSGGDREIPITWSNPTGTEALSQANVYVDPAGCDEAGNPISTLLVAGAEPPASITPIEVSGQTVSSAALPGDSLEYMQYVAVAVTLVDRAGNESTLSNVACVQRVPVTGFWDSYCAERGMDAESCRSTYGCAVSAPGVSAPGVSAPGTRGGGAIAGIALATALALVIGARGRRRRER